MSSPEEKPPLGPRTNRLWAYAGQKGITLDRMVSDVAIGLDDRRPKLHRLLDEPRVGTILVERRDRLARFGVGMVTTMQEARGSGLPVGKDKDVDDASVRDMTES